ncbi:hypothetical protein [Nocardioides litoris]|uniref:hypothetical protein n=1 Tax=Nocardioides litoris TaxID=1926648 RepID=UPI00111CAF57|nr:hypothetical protein [Nocardioides litoris]
MTGGVDEEVRVVERAGREAHLVVLGLTVLLGLLVALLVATVGMPLVALADGSATAGAVVLVLAGLVGVAVAAVGVVQQRRAARRPAVTVLGPAGVVRTDHDHTARVGWHQVVDVRWSAVGRGHTLALVTDPLDALVAPGRRSQQRARLLTRMHGATVALPLEAVPVSPDDLADRLGAWSAGRLRPHPANQ